jgi:hypothetical protein
MKQFFEELWSVILVGTVITLFFGSAAVIGLWLQQFIN